MYLGAISIYILGMKFSKGFTLIELLVVIAIIGILSSVVLASLNTARAKGSDSAIKAQLSAIRPQAEIVYDNLGSYGTSSAATNLAQCTVASTMYMADATIKNMITALINNAASGSVVCSTTGNPATAWAVSAGLKTTGYWCVDSTGASKAEGSTLSTAACP
jgi:prepilin-type N-terminal cleavage/methylation domain-containing protein